MNYLGIDLGTSSVKLLLLGEDGTILRTVSREYPLSMPQSGWSEQNPEDWWEQTKLGIREIMAGLPGESLGGISFGGQMHGLVALDDRDRVIRPAILWNDGRTGAETEYLNDTVGREILARCTGNIAFAGFTAPKLLWLRKHEPENFARIAKIMLPKDYLAYRLTGVHSCDYSDASGMLLLDVAGKRWSEEMLEICGVREGQMPKLFESWQVTGTVRPDIAQELGISPNVPVCAGAGDNAAAAVSTGTLENGSCNLSVGTSGTVFIACDEFVRPQNSSLHSFAHASGGFHLMGCILSAAACNKWWTEDILRLSDYGAAQGKGWEPEKNNVLFAPYLMGERTPHNDTAVRGGFFGLGLDTTREQMTQAILEGVAFAMRDSAQLAREMGIELSSCAICGGGAKSVMWREIFANVLNVPIVTAGDEVGPALGGAMLAGVGCGGFSDLRTAARQVTGATKTILPQPRLQQWYEEKYQRYRTLYSRVRDI